MRRVGQIGLLMIIVTAGIAVPQSPNIAHAEHTVIADFFAGVIPPWSGGDPWNGYKVLLSSPRHTDSRNRGECGWEENINGRLWNFEAAFYTPYASLGYRGYNTVISKNSRDGGFVDNREYGNAFGANVYIVTHSNATAGRCNSAHYLLVMHRTGNTNSIRLKDQLIRFLDPEVPGGVNTTINCDGLAECLNSNLAAHRAYVELFFHTNQAAVNWFQCCGAHGNAINQSWRYGAAIDSHLGYP